MFRTKKRFGQHFLIDKNVLSQIASYGDFAKGDFCIEIGPGQGALTKFLLKYDISLKAIELDQRLLPGLEAFQLKNENFSFILQDVLDVDFDELIDHKAIIIGNLPYEISTPLLFKLVSHRLRVSKMVFLLQKEMVDRICAEVDTKAYGRLSVMMQYYYETESLLIVPKEAFKPPPKVVSQVIRLTPRKRNWVNHEAFEAFVKFLFQHPRKMLRQRFKDKIEPLIWIELNIDLTVRAQTLEMETILRLFAYIQENNIQL
jgi:16S rRNA (adenine1518-N6/adenine1519-N6)-dimethyltransferase